MRAVPEWIGKNDNAMPPPGVRLRIFERAGGQCYLSGRKIAAHEKWELDHIVPLWAGGENRENNLAPALMAAHRKKSAADKTQQAKERRKRMKHLGINKSKNPMPGSRGSKWKKKISGETVLRDEG